MVSHFINSTYGQFLIYFLTFDEVIFHSQREREREVITDRQTERQTDRETDREREREG